MSCTSKPNEEGNRHTRYVTAKWFIGGVHTKVHEISLQFLKKDLPSGMRVPLGTPYSPQPTAAAVAPVDDLAIETQPPSTDTVSELTDPSTSTPSVATEDSNAFDCHGVKWTADDTALQMDCNERVPPP